ncbi:hypothetical protein Leryth_021518 [Lithospermum erythrorhizon]|nr:hypothetical protein Leryth_021518 [Lithospermum erythrorhizon]
MYTTEKPQPPPSPPLVYDNHHHRDMLIELPLTHPLPHQPLPEDENSTPQNHLKTPKKRAETWVQEETRALINFRREIDSLFNTSKSNKHLWDQISMKMREKGFDRSATMCTDKWRNLLKEFKKAKQNQDVNGSAKMLCYKEIEEILSERSKGNNNSNNSSQSNNNNNEGVYKSPSASKLESFMQFSEKGLDDPNIMFGPVEANGRQTLNLERQLDHDGHPLAAAAADAVAAGGVSPWNWRGTPGNGEQNHSFEGRVITVKWGDYVKRIGIDGTPNAIKEAIKSAFRLRTKRAFWLEDEDSIIRTLDRDMPLGNYILHVDEGLTIKICLYEEPDHLPLHTEDKTFYTEDDFRDFLSRRGWTCLREYNGFRNVDNLDELCPGAIYRGVN